MANTSSAELGISSELEKAKAADKFGSEIIKDPKAIVVVTGTLYPNWYEGEAQEPIIQDKLRGNLSLETLSVAKNLGYQVALVDGGSSGEFLKALEDNQIPYEIQKEGGTQGYARRQGLDITQSLHGIKVICETEPEKVSLVRECLPIAASPILLGEADVVIPKRTKAALATLPEYQAQSEKRSNEIYNKILKSHGLLKANEPDLDFGFGTRFFSNRPEVIGLFKKQYKFRSSNTALHQIIRPDIYSNPLMFPVVEALHRGLRVKSVEVPYTHPNAQTEYEEGRADIVRKRDLQRRTVITELVHFIRFLEKSPKSRLSEDEN